MLFKSKKMNWTVCLSWAWLFFCFTLLSVFIYHKSAHFLDSDMSSILVASWHNAKEHTLLSSEWYYSTELTFFSSQLVFTPLFMLFDNWQLVRTLGCAILYLLLLGSYYLLCSQLGFKRTYPISASFLLLPFSAPHFFCNLIAIYYLPHICHLFLLTGLFVRCTKALTKRKYIITVVLLCLSSLLIGLNGIRLLFFFHIPAFCLVILLVGFDLSNPTNSHSNVRRLFFAALTACISGIIGFLTNSLYLSKLYSFTDFTVTCFQDLNFERIHQLLVDLLAFLGYQTNVSIFSSALLSALLCLSVFLLLCFSIIHTLRKIRNANSSILFVSEGGGKYFVTLFWVIGFVLFAAVLALSDLHYWYGHHTILSMLIIPVIAGWFLEEHKWKRNLSSLLAGSILCLLLFSSANQYLEFYKKDTNYELRVISEVMVDEGYTEGYATFWQANVLTELSNGQLDMRAWPEDAIYREMMDLHSINQWLQTKSHESTVPIGKTFIVFSKYHNQQNEFALGRWLRDEDILFETDNFMIYGYESYSALLSSIDQHVDAVFADGQWLAENYRREGDPSLQPGAISVGPNVPLYPGSYTVTISGEGLSYLKLCCVYQDGELEAKVLSVSENEISFQLETDVLLRELEIQLDNTSSDVAVLNSLTIEKNSSSSLP